MGAPIKYKEFYQAIRDKAAQEHPQGFVVHRFPYESKAKMTKRRVLERFGDEGIDVEAYCRGDSLYVSVNGSGRREDLPPKRMQNSFGATYAEVIEHFKQDAIPYTIFFASRSAAQHFQSSATGTLKRRLGMKLMISQDRNIVTIEKED